jgi:hypothetical protein
MMGEKTLEMSTGINGCLKWQELKTHRRQSKSQGGWAVERRTQSSDPIVHIQMEQVN